MVIGLLVEFALLIVDIGELLVAFGEISNGMVVAFDEVDLVLKLLLQVFSIQLILRETQYLSRQLFRLLHLSVECLLEILRLEFPLHHLQFKVVFVSLELHPFTGLYSAGLRFFTILLLQFIVPFFVHFKLQTAHWLHSGNQQVLLSHCRLSQLLVIQENARLFLLKTAILIDGQWKIEL